MDAAHEMVSTFADLIARVRAGDAAATRELFDGYWLELKRYVRLRLTDARLPALPRFGRHLSIGPRAILSGNVGWAF